MGSPVSAVVDNLYMEFFEKLALETAPTRPSLWKRYVDDTFCILQKGSTEELLLHLNRVRPTIKFTVEQEENGTLPFLNMLVRRREDDSLDVSVYSKPTHTDRYFHFESHHLTHVKRGWRDVSMTGPGGSSARRTTFRRKLTTLLESSSKTLTLQTLSTALLPHPHRKQQTQAAVMRNRRRRGDHWW